MPGLLVNFEAELDTRPAPSITGPALVFRGRLGGGIVRDGGGTPWAVGSDAVCPPFIGTDKDVDRVASVVTELFSIRARANMRGEVESVPGGEVAARETARGFGLSLFEKAGLGSSLGAGEGNTFTGFLQPVLLSVFWSLWGSFRIGSR